MKVIYTLQTLWPTDVANPEGFEALDWRQSGEIPFLPVAGMEIDCGDGDFRTVERVYWEAGSPNVVVVDFANDDVARCADYWRRGGWRTEGLLA